VRRLALLLAGGLATLGAASGANAALVHGIINLSGPTAYQFGSFDLDTPTGSPGSYSYAWSSIGASGSTAMRNLARAPGSGDLYFAYAFTSYRAIGTDGTVGSELGTIPSTFGMAFDGSGGLYAIGSAGGPGTWYTLDPTDGAPLSSASTLSVYSTFGGNLTWSVDGNFYWADDITDSLYSISADGSDTEIGALAGGGFNGAEDLALFSEGDTTYLLNKDRLYSVDLGTAALTRLGTITGLPTNLLGFTGVAGTPSTGQAPAPATLALLAGGLALFRLTPRRGRRRTA
jgi:hypothetical protein